MMQHMVKPKVSLQTAPLMASLHGILEHLGDTSTVLPEWDDDVHANITASAAEKPSQTANIQRNESRGGGTAASSVASSRSNSLGSLREALADVQAGTAHDDTTEDSRPPSAISSVDVLNDIGHDVFLNKARSSEYAQVPNNVIPGMGTLRTSSNSRASILSSITDNTAVSSQILGTVESTMRSAVEAERMRQGRENVLQTDVRASPVNPRACETAANVRISSQSYQTIDHVDDVPIGSAASTSADNLQLRAAAASTSIPAHLNEALRSLRSIAARASSLMQMAQDSDASASVGSGPVGTSTHMAQDSRVSAGANRSARHYETSTSILDASSTTGRSSAMQRFPVAVTHEPSQVWADITSTQGYSPIEKLASRARRRRSVDISHPPSAPLPGTILDFESVASDKSFISFKPGDHSSRGSRATSVVDGKNAAEVNASYSLIYAEASKEVLLARERIKKALEKPGQDLLSPTIHYNPPRACYERHAVDATTQTDIHAPASTLLDVHSPELSPRATTAPAPQVKPSMRARSPSTRMPPPLSTTKTDISHIVEKLEATRRLVNDRLANQRDTLPPAARFVRSPAMPVDESSQDETLLPATEATSGLSDSPLPCEESTYVHLDDDSSAGNTTIRTAVTVPHRTANIYQARDFSDPLTSTVHKALRDVEMLLNNAT